MLIFVIILFGIIMLILFLLLLLFCFFMWSWVFIRPSLRRDVLWYTNVRLSVRPFHMSLSNLRTPWPIHFAFHRVIEIGGLTICILYGEISNFHSRVMGLYSSNCRRFFVYRAVNCEHLGQFTSNFPQLLELIVLQSVYFLVGEARFWTINSWKFKSEFETVVDIANHMTT